MCTTILSQKMGWIGDKGINSYAWVIKYQFSQMSWVVFDSGKLIKYSLPT
jgi:hypothetical protein